MRLIDADALIKHFEAIQKQEDAIGLDFVAIADGIKEQPTAYDPDQVVEQLERISDEMNDMILESDSPQYYDGYEEGVDKAIEIVKAGGVDGN